MVIGPQGASLVIGQYQPERKGGAVRAYENGKVFRTEGDGFSPLRVEIRHAEGCQVISKDFYDLLRKDIPPKRPAS